jgi:aubergine
MEREGRLGKRPSASKLVHKQPFITNYYSFQFEGTGNESLHKYSVYFEPQIPEGATSTRNKILNTTRSTLNDQLGFYIFMNTFIFSRSLMENDLELITSYDQIEYKIKIKWICQIDKGNAEQVQFLKIFFNSLLNKLKFKRIGMGHYNPAKAVEIHEYPLKIWPGFSASLHGTDSGGLVRLDIAYKVARTDSVLQLLNDILNDSRIDNPHEYAKEELMNRIVYTPYNNRTYCVHDIAFDRVPTDSFPIEEGETTTYCDYYSRKYGKKITQTNQPLLIHKPRNSTQEICLIPELCAMTGLNEDMRKDIRLMKVLSQKMHRSAKDRIADCRKLLSTIEENEFCREEINKWKIKIDKVPLLVEGRKMNAGVIQMKETQIHVEDARNLERDFQQMMRATPSLQNWGIFCPTRNKRAQETLLRELKAAFELFKLKSNPPRVFEIASDRTEDWIRQLKSIPEFVQVVIILIPGTKGRAPLYDPLKWHLLETTGIPSQFVLTSTLEKGKNVLSICCKIVVQICAKLGGIPWEITDLPFTERPVMIMGIDVFRKLRGKTPSVAAFCASLNPSATRYWSSIKLLKDGSEICADFKDQMFKALAMFKQVQEVYPYHILVYRDGISRSQQKCVLETEVLEMQNVLDVLESETGKRPKLTYISVNKRVTTRFFSSSEGEDPRNPLPGSVIGDVITGKDKTEFFLISQRSSQGVSTPTHYSVIYSDFLSIPIGGSSGEEAKGKREDSGEKEEVKVEEEEKKERRGVSEVEGELRQEAVSRHDESKDAESVEVSLEQKEKRTEFNYKLQELTYKLCYLYYNVAGSIRIPAPLKNAHKLAYLIGERARDSRVPIPKQKLENLNGLYYL